MDSWCGSGQDVDRRSWALSEKWDMSPAVVGIKDPGLVWGADLLLCPVRDPGSTANELQERRDEGSEGGWWAGAGTPPEGARGLRLVMSAAHSSPSLDTVPIIPYMPKQSVGGSSEVKRLHFRKNLEGRVGECPVTRGTAGRGVVGRRWAGLLSSHRALCWGTVKGR